METLRVCASIDLFLLRPADVAEDESGWAGDVAELAQLIRRWSGNPASIIQAAPGQVADMIARSEPLRTCEFARPERHSPNA